MRIFLIILLLIVNVNAQNLLNNGDFETGNPAPWTGNFGTVFPGVTNKKIQGNYAGYLKCGSTSYKYLYQMVTGIIPNEYYTISGYILFDDTIVTNGYARFRVGWLNQTTNTNSKIDGSDYLESEKRLPDNSGEFIYFSISGLSHPESIAATVHLYGYIVDKKPGDYYILYDAVKFEQKYVAPSGGEALFNYPASNAKLVLDRKIFSPYDNEKVKINFNLPYKNSDLLIRAYDSKGNIVRDIYNTDELGSTFSSCSGTVYWDGKDDFGKIVHIRPYFIYLEATNRYTGEVTRLKALIIVGRALE